MSEEETTAIPLSEEERTFQEMNQSLDNISKERQELANILLQTAKSTKLNPGEESPRMTEVKLAVFNAVDSLLKSQEALSINKAKMSMTKKSEATSDNVKQMAIEILRNINMANRPSAPVETREQDKAALEEAFAKSLEANPDLAIKDDELVVDPK